MKYLHKGHKININFVRMILQYPHLKHTMLTSVNEISWVTPAPLGDCLSGVYFKIFLEYFEQKFLKKSLKLKKIITLCVMVYINFFLKICYCQVHLQVLLLFKNISYNVFKMLLSIFHSLDWFQTFKVYIPMHWK